MRTIVSSLTRFRESATKFRLRARIRRASNSTLQLRRVRDYVERYGAEVFMAEMDGERGDQSKHGTMWHVNLGLSDVVFVEVINSTAEEDGTFKHYWLRVPPWLLDASARTAVAWTFGFEPSYYAPRVET